MKANSHGLTPWSHLAKPQTAAPTENAVLPIPFLNGL